MWCDHPFSQRNRATERTVWVGVAGNREVGGGGVEIGQKLKKGGHRQYMHSTPLPTM